ncbi:hypothetical protein GGX14DRAFT_380114 [Mycena pura]|uniref:Uncharacterized protein n=1 Tax=Mycena pura TaxID=153505 RepID=A0AAD6XZR0_9AGAR|nr:hypothetical protein GGX14DRAFT_380114 [Mycena pura]
MTGLTGRTGFKGVRRFQTKPNGQPHSDRSSTSNLKKHAEGCWGKEVVAARLKELKDASASREGSIFAAFARADQRPIKVTHRAHTEPELRQTLLGAGRPGLRIPSRRTVARDLNAAYERCSEHMKDLLENYSGRLSFATDAWTSPNHRAFVAWTVHLQHSGHPLVFLLDIYEVPEVRLHILC